jgi:ComF family protein
MHKHRWTAIFQPLLNLWFKSSCPLCQRPTISDFCPYCQKQLQDCQFPEGGHLSGAVPIFVWGQYSGPMKRAIAAMKYENRPDLARPLGHWLAESWLSYSEFTTKNLLVVPIPLHQKKLKERGFNQAELLASSFCNLTDLPLKTSGLERIKATQALFSLSPKDREKEVKEAFVLGKDFRYKKPSKPVLLLDDVYTTGNTITEATKTLQQAGVKVIGAAAIATTNKC